MLFVRELIPFEKWYQVRTVNEATDILGRCKLYTQVFLQNEPTSNGLDYQCRVL